MHSAGYATKYPLWAISNSFALVRVLVVVEFIMMHDIVVKIQIALAQTNIVFFLYLGGRGFNFNFYLAFGRRD